MVPRPLTEAYLVQPDEVCVLAAQGLEGYEIDPLDMFNYTATGAYVIPEIVDVPRFVRALARTLSRYPLWAGRAHCSANGSPLWKISLDEGVVPLVVIESDADRVVPRETVVQRPLAYCPVMNTGTILNSSSEPLARLQLTLLPRLNSTVIGITRWHALGSHFVTTRFARALSDAYRGVTFADPVPVCRPLTAFLPRPSYIHLAGVDTTALRAYYPATRVHPQLDPAAPQPARLDFRLSDVQLEQLRMSVDPRTPVHSPLPRLSRQDCLVALIASALNASDHGTPPIHTITTVLDLRDAGDIPGELAGNGFTFAPTDSITPGRSDDLYAFANAVRHSIERAREPEFLAALLDVQGKAALEAARKDPREVMDLASPPGHMMVNSYLRFDASGAHFGHPGETRTYVGIGIPFLRHIRISRPNDLHDKNDMRTGWDAAVEVTMWVGAEMKQQFMRELEGRVIDAGIEGHIDWI